MIDTFFLSSHWKAARLSVAIASMAVASFVLAATPLHAATYNWAVASGNWSNSANWGGALPTSNDTANIVNGGTASITMTVQFGSLSLGSSTGSGTVIMTGGDFFQPSFVTVGNTGIGTFVQIGGTSSEQQVELGNFAGGIGTYALSGGSLWGNSEVVGAAAAGVFNQSGGSNGTSEMYIGYVTGSSGTYSLNSGMLSAQIENVGYQSAGNLIQSGGTNTVPLLLIATNSTYLLGGGVLQVSGTLMNRGVIQASNLVNQGLFAGNGVPATLNAGSILDMSSGSWQNLGGISLNMGPNSLLIVPAGFNTSTNLASYSTLGLTNTIGTTLNVPAGQGFAGTDTITDPVNCQGTIAANGGVINLNNGLVLSGTGSINLGSGGNLTVNDNLSGISGGTLVASNQFIGSGGTGSFTQSGGQLSVPNQYVGYSGAASFTQTAGVNSVSSSLSIGYSVGASGTYSLSGGSLNTPNAYVGYAGTGTFLQSGGTNSVSGSLALGYSGGSGTYVLSGSGQLAVPSEFIGSVSGGSSLFQQTGGANVASYISIGRTGRYALSGGTLSIANVGDISNQGSIDCTNSTASLNIGNECLVDLSGATLTNVEGMSVSMGSYSLMIVPAGFSPSTSFGYYTNLGLTHTAGTTLTVLPGQRIAVNGSINDPVNCQGTIMSPSGGPINLNNGLIVSGSAAYVNLGGGTLTTNDLTSQISGGTMTENAQFTGSGGTGTFTQSGGMNSAQLYLGKGATDVGTYYLNGNGQITGREYIGYSGFGAVIQSGANNNSGAIYLGYNAGSSGTYSLSGSGLMTSLGEGVYVGVSGTGSFAQSSGTTNSSYFYVGYGVGSSGSYSLGRGVLSTVYGENVGDNGTGTFTQTGGANLPAQGLVVGTGTGSVGSYSLSGNSLLATTNGGGEVVGGFGSGTFTQTGGTNNSINSLYVGQGSTSSAIYALSGNALLSVSGAEYVGYSGTGTVTQTGGTNSNINNQLTLGDNFGSHGIYNLSGSGQLSTGGEWFGYYYGSGTFTQSGGTNNSGQNLFLGDNGGSQAVYNLNGGLLVLSSLIDFGGTVTFNFNGGTLKASSSFSTSLPMTLGTSGGGAAFDTAGFTVTLSGSLSGPGSLTKVDSGTLILSASNSYTGDTLVNAGTLILDYPDLAATSNAWVDNHGSGGVLDLNYHGTDKISALYINGVAQPPGIWGGPGSGAPNTSSYLAGSGLLNVVPEPSTLALLAAGAIGLFGYRWRRKATGASE
jgi:hypothetical protein